MLTFVFVCFILFAIKHFVVDFLLQFPYQYLNKGTLFHPGGIIHAGFHGIATYIILACLMPSNKWQYALLFGFVDMVLHYWIDFGKVRINQLMGWKCNTSEYFWYFVGLDQFLHQVTYIGIIWFAVRVIG